MIRFGSVGVSEVSLLNKNTTWQALSTKVQSEWKFNVGVLGGKKVIHDGVVFFPKGKDTDKPLADRLQLEGFQPVIGPDLKTVAELLNPKPEPRKEIWGNRRVLIRPRTRWWG